MPLIVVSLDFTDGSIPALQTAAAHAERIEAELHLFHADVLFDGSDSPDPEAHRARLTAFAEQHLGEDRVAALDPATAAGRGLAAAPPILDYTERVGADLLVVGTHGRRGLRRLVLGSVAEETVREASCPVLVVPSRAAATLPDAHHPIVAPVDFSDLNEHAIALAATWAKTYDAPLHLVHIVEMVGPYPEFYPDSLVPSLAVGGIDDVQALAMEHRLEQRAEEELRSHADRLRREGVGNVHLFVGYGKPDLGIAEHAEEHNAALLTMATHGLSGLSHALIGSVTEKTARRAPCAVLTVRAKG